MRATPLDLYRKVRLPRYWGAEDERPLLEWACDADEHTGGRLRIREQVLVDPAGQLHLAPSLLPRTTRER